MNDLPPVRFLDGLDRLPRAGLVALLLIWAAGAAIRLDGIGTRGLEYDEVFTVENYLVEDWPAALFGLDGTLNNHRLNTLLLRLTGTGGGQPWRVRLPAFLLGVLTLPLLFALATRVSRDPWVGLLASALYAGSALASYYSQAGRGHGMSAFLVALHAWAWWRWRIERGPVVFALLATLVGLVGVWNLPTFLVYLGPVLVLGAILGWRARDRRALPFDVLLVATTGAWLWFVRSSIGDGYEKFATDSTNTDLYLRAIVDVVVDLYAFDTPPWLLVAGLVGCLFVRMRPAVLALAALLAVPIAVGLTGKNLPVRIYLQLLPLLHLLVAWGLVSLVRTAGVQTSSRRALAMLVGLGLAAGFANLPERRDRALPSDARVVLETLERIAMPGDAIAFHPHDALPARRHGADRLAGRWRDEGRRPRRLLCVGRFEPTLVTFDIEGGDLVEHRIGSSVVEPIPAGRHRWIHVYDLAAVEGPVEAGEILFVLLVGEPTSDPLEVYALESLGATNVWLDPDTRLAVVRTLEPLAGPPSLADWLFLRPVVGRLGPRRESPPGRIW